MSRERSLPGFPERTLQVPTGCVLSDAEIVDLIRSADQRKRAGDAGVTVADAGAGFTVSVPKTCPLTREEAIVILTRANEAKAYQHADLLVTFADAAIVKLWVTLKSRGLGHGQGPWIGGSPLKQF
ncbi:MAG: hypothetical protein ACREKS_01320 [Candidatus Rokuibacteriota bacterium]